MKTNAGSLSTIVAGVLVLITMVIGILIGITALSMVTTLGSVTANHVKEVGVESAMYSGLIIQGNELLSTKGSITIIGAITPEGFTWINKTTQLYMTNSSEPELLLTNAGPVLLDPVQIDAGDQATLTNPVANYLWHWVDAVVTTAQGQKQYSGVIVSLGNGYYLLSVDPNYVVGPLTGTNAYITKDLGIGAWGCEAMYGFISPGNGWETICPSPPGGPITTSVYGGYWPQIEITSVNSTAIELTITFLQGTSFIRVPQYFSLYVLSQGNPGWLNVVCQGQHLLTQIPNPNPPYNPLPAPNNCTFDMAWIHYQYQQGSACYNGGWIWCTLTNSVTYNVIMNLNAQSTGSYYLVMIVTYPPGNPSQWFAWNITGTKLGYPTWLDTPGQPANVLTPP
jgi:hypothetical protein